MGVMMTFPASVEEFMEQYKMTDTEHVYSNGTEYVPIYRMKQWFENLECCAKMTERTVSLMERKTEMHAQICSELHELYEAKNADYGDAFSKTFDEYGMVAPLLRLEDKLSRLKSLHRKGVQQIKQESVRDTLIDLANYAIMTVMELDSQEESRWE